MAVLDRVEQALAAAARARRRGGGGGTANSRPVAPASRSSASAASRISGAPAWIRPCVPADSRCRHRARDGADGAAELRGEVRRRQRAGALGRLHDDRGRAERGDDPVAGDEAPAVRLRARRQLGDHRAAPRDRRRAAASRAPDRRRARCRRARRSSRPGASSAPACAAESTPSARPETTGTPRRRQPAPERAGDLEPVGRRPPRADDRHRVLGLQRRRIAEDVQHRRRVGEVAQPLGVGVAAAGRPSQARPPRPARAPRARRSARSGAARPPPPPSSSRSSSGSASTRPGAVRRLNSTCSRPAIAAIRSVRRRQSSHAVMRLPPPRAGSRVVEAQARGDARRARRPTTSEPSRSATVRATRRMRVWPRAESEWRS